ncbi:MAG TPA: tetratricopeptide repeat protein [Chlorobaculum sp.]|nr:tetratricopeptide repeat protein [Chlorobaculum sp.]
MIDQRIQQAVELHRQGQFVLAQSIYEEILETRPDHFEALNLLGLLSVQTQNHRRAVDLIDQAIAIFPDNAASHFNRGMALQALGQPEAAVAGYEKAIGLRPDHAEAWSNRGVALHDLKRCDEAVRSYDRATAIRPDYAEAWSNRGNSLFELKALDEAVRSYERALAIRPDYAEAWSNRGNVLMELMQWEEAVESYGRAIALMPENAEAWFNRGNALQALKQFAGAAGSYEKALSLRPDFAEAWFNHGNTLLELRHGEAAIASYDHAITLMPEHAQMWCNRGNAFMELGRLEDAIASYERATAIRPDYAEAWSNRGNVLLKLKGREGALASYDRAIALNPDYSEVWYNRGNALYEMMQLEAAAGSYDRAVELEPDYAEAWSNRGLALHGLRQWDAALESFEKALNFRPDFFPAWSNRGNTMLKLNRPDAAIASYDRAIALNPDYAEAWFNRCVTLFELKQYDDAAESLVRALLINPDGDYWPGLLLHVKMMICDWTDYADMLGELLYGIVNRKRVSTPFQIISGTGTLSLIKQAVSTYVEDKHPSRIGPQDVPCYPKRDKIRVGYYSADFHDHATMYLMAELFEKHDRTSFEITAFSFGPDLREDPMRKRAVRAFDRFIDVGNISDREVAALSRELEIDIAVDLKGFTKDSRPDIFAFRAAPIQVNYLGYPGTMGLEYMDYIIADQTLVPERFRQFYTEKTVSLPDSYQTNDSKRRIANKVFTRQECGLPATGFVFCCFNNNYKINPDIFDCWMRILDSVEGSVLWLLEDNPRVGGNLRKEALRRGIDAGRLVFAGRMPLPEHLARHRLADLFLDTFPCNAHTTASDALWAGLPVLTCKGESFAGRVAASLLNAIRLPELITSSEVEYEALATELANDPEKLREIKLKLEHNRLTAPLFDSDRFTRHFESALSEMYERYHRDLPPDHIYVERCEPVSRV